MHVNNVTIFFLNTRGAYHCIKQKKNFTVFSYNPNETDSRWTQTGKPAQHNPKQKLYELLTSHATTTYPSGH
jgi:hypothetical protein